MRGMSDPLQLAARLARQYLDGLDARAVAPTAEAIEALARLRTPLPDGPTDAAAVLAQLDAIGSPATMASAGGRFFGFVTGGVAAGRRRRQLAGDRVGSERRALHHVARSRSRSSASCSSGCVELLASARRQRRRARHRRHHGELHRARRRAPQRARARRLERRRRRPVRRAAHHRRRRRRSARRASSRRSGCSASVASASSRVPLDGQGRMRADRLPRLERADDRLHAGGQRQHRAPAIRSARSADAAHAPAPGSTSTALSACGPRAAPERADSGRRRRARRLVGRRRAQVAQRAVRQRRRLRARRRGAARAPCRCSRRLPRRPAAPREPCHATPEMSRRARGVEIWAALAHARPRRRRRADRALLPCTRARFAERLRAAGFDDAQRGRAQPGAGRRSATTRARNAVVAAVQRDGTCWCGPTVWHGRTRHAHQRLQLGDERGRRRARRRRHRRRRSSGHVDADVPVVATRRRRATALQPGPASR